MDLLTVSVDYLLDFYMNTMSSMTKKAISKSSAKIMSFLTKARDESTELETENSNVFDDTSCSLQTVHHEDGGMSTPTDTSSKKRVAS